MRGEITTALSLWYKLKPKSKTDLVPNFKLNGGT
jgi:hypothetical protein